MNRETQHKDRGMNRETQHSVKIVTDTLSPRVLRAARSTRPGNVLRVGAVPHDNKFSSSLPTHSFRPLMDNPLIVFLLSTAP